LSKIDNTSDSDEVSILLPTPQAPEPGARTPDAEPPDTKTPTASGRRPSAARASAEPGLERPSRRSRKTRAALVDAARRLLAEQGTGALTVKAVTDLADVGHGTFYHHFASTEALLAAGIEESMREFSAAMEKTFSDAPDKAWVFAASFTSMFRMLVAHPALPWMLERPQVLAQALREGCGPYAVRDVEAMVAAGDLRVETVAHRGHYWEWILIGALVDAAARPERARSIEADILSLVLGLLGLDEKRVASLVARAGDTEPAIPVKDSRP
jgi:AcrR family transcriptional regulator